MYGLKELLPDEVIYPMPSQVTEHTLVGVLNNTSRKFRLAVQSAHYGIPVEDLKDIRINAIGLREIAVEVNKCEPISNGNAIRVYLTHNKECHVDFVPVRWR